MSVLTDKTVIQKLNSETNIVVIIVGLKYTTVTVGLIELKQCDNEK